MFICRNWFDCGRCSTFHDKYRQHMDPVSDEQIKMHVRVYFDIKKILE